MRAKQIRLSVFLVYLTVLAMIVGACEKTSATSSLKEPAEPTGYSDGRYEISYLFVNGMLFQESAHFQSTEDSEAAKMWLKENSFDFYGEIQKTDMYNIPDEDLSATYLPIGTEIYINYKSGEEAAVIKEGKIQFFTRDLSLR